MTQLFNTFLYDPIFNTLLFLYHALPGQDMGVAIIVLTLLTKIILFWPALSALKAQKSLQDTQPQIEAIREKYKDNKEEMGRQLMDFYKQNKVNPFSSCLPLLIQLPILLALYHAFFQGLQVDPTTHLLTEQQLSHVYGWILSNYGNVPIDTTLFGWVNLASKNNIFLAVLAGAASFIQAKMLQAKRPKVQSTGAKDENVAAMVNKQMLYIIPVMTIIFGYQFPAGVTLYWLVSTLFSIAQQFYFLRVRKKLVDATDVKQLPTS